MVSARIPELDKCVCGCTLRSGSLIIAAVSMVLSGLLGISSVIALIYTGLELNTYPKVSIVYLSMVLVIAAVLEIFSVFLWIGIKQVTFPVKHKETYVLSWAIITTAFNLIQLILFCLVLLFGHLALEVFIFGFEICVLFYAALVVYSYYREIRREKNKPQTLRDEA